MGSFPHLRSNLAALGLCLCALTSFAADRDDKAISFTLPVLPEMQRHLYLLENPAYLVLVLENLGMSPSLSSKLTLKDRTGFEIRNLAVQFAGKSGSVYRYNTQLKLSIAGVASEVAVPAEVDIAGLAFGKVIVKAHPPLASSMPSMLLEKVDFKLKLITEASRQREILRYLDGLPQKSATVPDARLEAIITEAYNRSSSIVISGKDTGEAVPLAEQLGLIVTIIIWLIAVPVVLLLRYRRNLRKARAQHNTTLSK